MNSELLLKRLNQYVPEPLIDDENHLNDDFHEIETIKESSPSSSLLDNNNRKIIVDMAKVNYLNILNNNDMKKCAEEIIRNYGVGTCGPRAFYGTTDIHLNLETVISKFLNMEESIVYSFGFVAISSSIAAYCKRRDVVFIDEYANIPIQQGLLASKSQIIKFSHNDPNNLEKLAENVPLNKRKFLIIEGINWETGKLCDLPRFIEVAEKYKMRIFLEESFTLGIFGDHGRGLTEYYNIEPSRIDMIFGTLEGALGSIGGFCAGSNQTIEHQRLAGSGYIFSASLPAYLTQVCIKSIENLNGKPKKFRKLSLMMHEFFENLNVNVISHPESPFKVIQLQNKEAETKFHQFCQVNGLNFIQKNRGLLFNLNIKLLDNENYLNYVKNILENALKSLN